MNEVPRFLSEALHELRQPMQALNFYISALLNVELPEAARPLLKSARQCTQMIDEMFLSLLEHSRIEAQTEHKHIEQFPVAILLKKIEADFAQQAIAKGITLRIASCREWIESDIALLEKILRNLASNAIRFTSSGKVLIGCRRKKSALRIEVHDTGMGISRQLIQSKLHKFFQPQSKRTLQAEYDNESGLGLGLADVQRLSKQLSSPISFASVEGRGSTFAIDVPLIPTLLKTANPKLLSPSLNTFCEKLIVVVDDNALILDAMQILLEQWNCKVVAAKCGKDAINKLRNCTNVPDLIMSDYHLSGESGIDLIRTIRDEFNEAIPRNSPYG